MRLIFLIFFCGLFSFDLRVDVKSDTIYVGSLVEIKVSVENNVSFYEVRAKLPASLTGKYARIHLQADGMLGCTGKDGWLLKIRDKPEGAE